MQRQLAQNRLTEIATAVNEAHAEVENTLRKSLSRALEVGELLAEAKSLVKHGEWGKWIAGNCAFSERTAQNYMRLAERYPELGKSATVADLTYRQAVGLLAEPKPEPSAIPPDVEESQPPADSDWLARLEWSNRESARLHALADWIVARAEELDAEPEGSMHDVARLGIMEASRHLLKSAERGMRYAELIEQQTKLKERVEAEMTFCGAVMCEIAEDEVYPLLSLESRQKVDDWVTWARQEAAA